MAKFSGYRGNIVLQRRGERTYRNVCVNTNPKKAIMHGIGFCRKFKEEAGDFLVADEDVVWPLDEGWWRLSLSRCDFRLHLGR